jgi:hypothetical protein
MQPISEGAQSHPKETRNSAANQVTRMICANVSRSIEPHGKGNIKSLRNTIGSASHFDSDIKTLFFIRKLTANSNHIYFAKSTGRGKSQ